MFTGRLLGRWTTRAGGVMLIALCAGLATAGIGFLRTAHAGAPETAPLINVSFGPSEIWMPSQSAITALHDCQPITLACVQQAMAKSGASADAMAFYQLTGWFLSDYQDTGTVQVGTVFDPWRANANSQPALLGGTPAVIFPEKEATAENLAAEAQNDPGYGSLKAMYPNLLFWGSNPSLESQGTSPQGGQRFIFDYRLLNGCHACAVDGIARFAFDFSQDGMFEGARLLSIAPPPSNG